MLVDHIDGNHLNNKMNNYRIVSNHLNRLNHGISKNNTSGATGVYYREGSNTWYGEIKYNYKKINLGTFDTFKEALETREKAELKYFGENGRNYIRLNEKYGGIL